MKYIVEVGGERVEVTVTDGEVIINGERLAARLEDVDDTPLAMLTLGTNVHRVAVQRGPARGRYVLVIDGRRSDVDALDERARTIREMAAATRGDAGPSPLIAPMPGLIVRVNVRAGDVIAAGQGLVTMEAMKMENELRASAAGTVSVVHVTAGAIVERGAVLVELE